MLSISSPLAYEQTNSISDSVDSLDTSNSFEFDEKIQFSTLPLLVLANKTQYEINLSKYIAQCNKVYEEFVNSDEGRFFQGQVYLKKKSSFTIN